jgi:hypothetical protein
MKHRVIAISFLSVLCAVFLLNLFSPPEEFSRSERRRLAQMPEFSLSGAADGSFMRKFDAFAVDQIAFREQYRRLKAIFDLNVLRKLDSNGIFVIGGEVYKTDYPLNPSSVLRLCGIVNAMYTLYLDETNSVWHTLVPDKNAFIVNPRHLVMDYAEMEDMIKDALDPNIAHVGLFDTLSSESFYRTDPHWRQEKIIPAAVRIAGAMGADPEHKPFTPHSFDGFYGAYYGQSALNIRPDVITWLVSDTTESAVVTNEEKPGEFFPVYDLSRLEEVDPYSIFMCGPAALVTAKNPLIDNGRRLILFRDSFASALAPLLLDAYEEITLIDLRYVNPGILGQFVDFTGADVLFIYSAGLYNNSSPVRGAAVG